MQPNLRAIFGISMHRGLILSLLPALAIVASGCSRSHGLSAVSGSAGGACDQGLLAVGAWKCLSDGLRAARLSAPPVVEPVAQPVAGPVGDAAAETGRP